MAPRPRVVTAALLHEANTFSPRATTMADFERGGFWRGAAALDRTRGINVEMAGFQEVAAREGWALLPLLSAHAQPAGRVDRPVCDALHGELLDGLRAAGPVDAVLLALHGAMAAEGLDDPDGDLLAAARALVGPAVPVVASLDLHANVTRRMARAATALVGYHTSPHVDVADTGRRAAGVVTAVLGGRRPVMACRKLAMITPAERHRSEVGPYGELFRLVASMERRPGILSVSLFTVQPWLDVEELGWTAAVVADGDGTLAERAAAELAEQAWARRDQLLVELVSLPVALERVRRSPEGPVILVDSADSTNSGATGDGTAVLEAVLGAPPVGGTVLLHVVDAEAAQAATRAGPGREVTLEVGGRLDRRHGRPVRLTATVAGVSDGRYAVESPMHHGRPADVGRAAVLSTGEVRLVVCEAPPPGHDPGIYRHLGLDPRRAKAVQVKSPTGFRAWYEPLAADIVLLDTPGLATPNLASLRFVRAPRPLFPLDR